MAALKTPIKTVNITQMRNNGTLPTRTTVPLSTTDPKVRKDARPLVSPRVVLWPCDVYVLTLHRSPLVVALG